MRKGKRKIAKPAGGIAKDDGGRKRTKVNGNKKNKKSERERGTSRLAMEHECERERGNRGGAVHVPTFDRTKDYRPATGEKLLPCFPPPK